MPSCFEGLDGEPGPRRRRELLAHSPESVADGDADALVGLALGFGLGHLKAAHLAGGRHVGAAVGLFVEADDVHHPDLGD